MTTIFWGDSHAEGGARALRGTDKGIVGAQLGAVRTSFPPSSMPRGSTVAIEIGTNDLTIHSGWSDAQIRSHAQSVVRTAMEMRAAGANPVIFAVPIPERPYTGGNWTAATLREFQENARIYNAELARTARANGINFVNFQPTGRDFSGDNLHLTAAAYQRMFAMANGVSFSPPAAAPPPAAPRSAPAAASPDPAAPAPPAAAPPAAPLPPPTFTPALNTALTAFLTGDASAAEITALKGAVSVTDSNPPGHLDGRGGVNGAATIERTRTALGGPLSATNHPELYTLATARYTALTGLPADRAATPAEIDAAEARIRAMTPEQRAEYQSVSYLLGYNDTRLSNGQINVDGVYGTRTESSIAAANTALHPAAAAAPAPPAAPVAASSASPVASGDITVAASADVRSAFPGVSAPIVPAVVREPAAPPAAPAAAPAVRIAALEPAAMV